MRGNTGRSTSGSNLQGSDPALSNSLTDLATREENLEAEPIAAWRLHDLRTILSRAKQCLSHLLKGVRATYDRHTFCNEKKEAFEALSMLLQQIVNPPDDTNIVAFPQTANE